MKNMLLFKKNKGNSTRYHKTSVKKGDNQEKVGDELNNSAALTITANNVKKSKINSRRKASSNSKENADLCSNYDNSKIDRIKKAESGIKKMTESCEGDGKDEDSGNINRKRKNTSSSKKRTDSRNSNDEKRRLNERDVDALDTVEDQKMIKRKKSESAKGTDCTTERTSKTKKLIKKGKDAIKKENSKKKVSGVTLNKVITKDKRNGLSKSTNNKIKSSTLEGFEPRTNLIKLLTHEPCFRIQIFSFESIEIFENFLKSNSISYVKETTNTLNLNKRNIYLVQDDYSGNNQQMSTTNKIYSDVKYDSCRIILYSNNPNFSFIPYKFVLSLAEKQKFMGDDPNLLCNKTASMTSLSVKYPDPFEFTANTLNYVQSLIILAMLRETKFLKICKEVQSIDPKIDNSFLIQSELNWLTDHKFCKKSGDLYKIAISDLTVKKICEKLGFKNIDC